MPFYDILFPDQTLKKKRNSYISNLAYLLGWKLISQQTYIRVLFTTAAWTRKSSNSINSTVQICAIIKIFHKFQFLMMPVHNIITWKSHQSTVNQFFNCSLIDWHYFYFKSPSKNTLLLIKLPHLDFEFTSNPHPYQSCLRLSTPPRPLTLVTPLKVST